MMGMFYDHFLTELARLVNPSFALHPHGTCCMAVTSLYLALEIFSQAGHTIPDSSSIPPQWWQSFDVTLDQIQGVDLLSSSTLPDFRDGFPHFRCIRRNSSWGTSSDNKPKSKSRCVTKFVVWLTHIQVIGNTICPFSSSLLRKLGSDATITFDILIFGVCANIQYTSCSV